jgi:hypothetical protein
MWHSGDATAAVARWREESKPSSVPDGHLSRCPEPGHRSRRRLRDCSRLLASASNRLCRPVRRLLQGGLPFSLRPAVPGGIGHCCSRVGRSQRANLDCRRANPPPRLSPGTPLCAARTFLWPEGQRPSFFSTPLPLESHRLSKYRPRHRGAGEVWCRRGDLNSHALTGTTP